MDKDTLVKRLDSIVQQTNEIQATSPKNRQESKDRNDRIVLLQAELKYLKEQLTKLGY